MLSVETNSHQKVVNGFNCFCLNRKRLKMEKVVDVTFLSC